MAEAQKWVYHLHLEMTVLIAVAGENGRIVIQGGAEFNTIPGDGNKRDPERENWQCRVILPIQSISGSHLLPSPGITKFFLNSAAL